MTNVILFAVFAFLSPQQVGDILTTSDGPVHIHPVHHGSLVLEWNNLSIYIDPYGVAERYERFSKPDLILVTDIHQDHLDLATLNALKTKDATFIVPPAVAEQLPDELKRQSNVLKNGGQTEYKGIKIEALPMYNLPETEDSRHPKGRGNGYVFTIGDKRIYISGDTEDTPEMRALHNIDVAFVCMNLPYTMGVEEAASAVLEFKPKVVYPYHYRGQDGLSDIKKFEQLVKDNDRGIEVRLRDWYGKP